MATTSMAANTYRGDRRGPMPQNNRHGGRNNYNPRQNMRRSTNMQQQLHHHHQHHQPQQTQAQGLVSPVSHGDRSGSVYDNERCVRAIMTMLGQRAVLTTANGGEYEGVLTAVSPYMDIELKEARCLQADQKTPVSRGDQVDSLMIHSKDVMYVTTPNIDTGSTATVNKSDKSEFLTDGAIGRSNGAEGREAGLKPLVAWKEENENSEVSELNLDLKDGAEGWDAEDMFRTNEKHFAVKSSYEEDMRLYTTPMPKFASKAEQVEAENRAAQAAREIESSEGYRTRMNVENNSSMDEEAKFSAVVRNQTDSSSSRAYVPPGRRQQQDNHSSQLNQRGAAPQGMSSHQALPQRERRADRDRGDRNHHDQRGADRDKISRTPPLRNPHSVPPPQPQVAPPQHAQQSKDTPDRLTGERRPEGSARGGYPPRPSHQEIPAQLVGVHQSVAAPQHPVNQGAGHQQTHAPPLTPNHHIGYNHVASPASPAVVATKIPPAQLPPSSLPSLGQMQNRSTPPPHVSSAPVVCSSQNTALPTPAENKESSLPPSSQHQQQSGTVANVSSLSSMDKKSPREKDRQEQQVAKLKEFHDNFVLEESEPRLAQQERPQEKQTENEERGQSGPGPGVPATAPSQAVPVIPPVSGQGAVSPPSGSQGAGVGDVAVNSTLNPNAMEFKPRVLNQPQPQPTTTVHQNPSPGPTLPTGPSGTPPQGPRQSPGMMSQPTLMPYNPSPFLQHAKMVPVANQSQSQVAKAFQQPKRAVVSVDPVALAHSATGQPLTLGPQAPHTMQQTSFVYVPPTSVLQPYPHPVQMRVMQSIPQGAGMDPSLGATGQQPHPVTQQFIMAQQPVPAHMPGAQAMPQGMPQPAHTMHQHLPQHTLPPHQSNMPPATQNNVNPHPAASPVQHLGGNGHNHGPPQMNHTQGAPPTSNTPQSGMFGHQIPAILPPQGAAGHAMPAHTVAQGPTPLQFLHQHHPLPSAASFSQAGATGGSGPNPAHVQQSGHVNHTHHVVVMPHPPAQAINQAPINNPPHQQHQQHAAAAPFQQIQGASNQLHGPVAPNQHLLQGNIPNSGGGMSMHHSMHPYVPQGVQGSHTHGVSHGHNHTGGHGHSHGHGHHFQGQ